MTQLTTMQYRTLEAYCEVGSGKMAAHRLGIAEQTVKNHLLDVRRITGAVNTAQLCYMLGSGDLDRRLPEPEDG